MRADDRDDGELFKALVARARKAFAEVAEKVRAAEVLVQTSEAIRQDFSARCAWCGRFRLGERWIGAEELPPYATSSRGLTTVSHTICPSCAEDLRASGKSV
jgi:hypothetical protein